MFNLSPEYLFLLVAILVYMVLKPRSWWPFALLMLVMTFMGVFRGLEVGTDHLGYEEDFYLLKSWNDMKRIYHGFEIGYVGIILFFKQFSNNYLWFSGLTFLVPMVGTYFFVKTYKVSPAWALFVFYALGIYFTAFNAMRQYMAICIIAAFTPWLYRRKYLAFTALTVLVSLAFHKSTLFMLTLIPIFWYTQDYKRMLSKKTLYIGTLISFSLWYVGSIFLIKTLMPVLALLNLDERYGGYVQNVNENLGNNISLMNTLFTMAVIYFCPKGKFNGELLIVVFYCWLFNVFNLLSVYATRIAFPYQYYMIALFPLIIYVLRGYRRLLFSIGVFFYCILQFIMYYCISNNGDTNPYTNWLFS